MKSSNQKGFTFVEGLLIVLIVTVLGVGGYLVWSKNRSGQSTAPTANNLKQQGNAESEPAQVSYDSVANEALKQNDSILKEVNKSVASSNLTYDTATSLSTASSDIWQKVSNDGKWVVLTYHTQSHNCASGAETCDSGAYVLTKKTAATWNFVAILSAQTPEPCSVLDNQGIPADMGLECVSSEGDTIRPVQ